jgi:uncharacterized membrane protein YcjF (UPF0283 family)
MNLCRICLEEDHPEHLLAPCRCTGTSKWVHRNCLNKWRAESSRSFYECTTCKMKYIIDIQTEIDIKARNKKLGFRIAIDIFFLLFAFALYSYFVGWIYFQCYTQECTTSYTLIHGAVMLFAIVGMVVLFIVSIQGGTGTGTVYGYNDKNVIYITCAIIGFVVVVAYFHDMITKKWKEHFEKRKRAIHVEDYVVRDLSKDVL